MCSLKEVVLFEHPCFGLLEFLLHTFDKIKNVSDIWTPNLCIMGYVVSYCLPISLLQCQGH